MALLRSLPFVTLFQIIFAIHNDMTHDELHHIFGVRHKREVPNYFVDVPKRRKIDNEHVIKLSYNGQEEDFLIKPYTELFTDGFHMIVKDGLNGSSMSLLHPDADCVYRGHSLSNNRSLIAVVGCGKSWRGMISTEAGENFLIHPHPRRLEHIIHKRNAEWEGNNHTCLFDHSMDPYPGDRYTKKLFGGLSDRLAVLEQEELTIELAVFADDAMWRHFQKLYGSKAEVEMHRFILAAVNNIDILYSQRTLQPRLNVKIVRYEVLKRSPDSMSKKDHRHGDVDRLLESFCIYQDTINTQDDRNPAHWDHALLFSGYDLYRDGLRTVAGYAPVKGMCSGARSCTINEGLDFGSVFVVTHEMGHSLGMYHDGDNECDLRCCIMSPSVGSGKTEWSQCSAREFNVFLMKLGTHGRPPNCLLDNPQPSRRIVRDVRDSPGQQFTLDQQCSIFHGECWKHELKDGQELEEVCEMLWCGNGEGIIRTAHPALEGSHCGPGKWCRKGQCRTTSVRLIPVDGGWSGWNDHPGRSCIQGCSSCEIQKQLRLRRSVRQCNKPHPQNGGAPCRGDDARGLRCDEKVCTGPTPDEYAKAFCTSLRDDNETPNPQLSGHGLQFEQAMCKIWCQMANSNNIRTVANYPDGTPCGNSKYCVKGECRNLLCGGEAVVETREECPFIPPEITQLSIDEPPAVLDASQIRHTKNTFAIPNEDLSDEETPFLADEIAEHLHFHFVVYPHMNIPHVLFRNTTRKIIPIAKEFSDEEGHATAHHRNPSTKHMSRTDDDYFWSSWSEWSDCYGIHCDRFGTQVRSRICSVGNCPGAKRQKRKCHFICDGSEPKTLAFSSKVGNSRPVSVSHSESAEPQKEKEEEEDPEEDTDEPIRTFRSGIRRTSTLSRIVHSEANRASSSERQHLRGGVQVKGRLVRTAHAVNLNQKPADVFKTSNIRIKGDEGEVETISAAPVGRKRWTKPKNIIADSPSRPDLNSESSETQMGATLEELQETDPSKQIVPRVKRPLYNIDSDNQEGMAQAQPNAPMRKILRRYEPSRTILDNKTTGRRFNRAPKQVEEERMRERKRYIEPGEYEKAPEHGEAFNRVEEVQLKTGYRIEEIDPTPDSLAPIPMERITTTTPNPTYPRYVSLPARNNFYQVNPKRSRMQESAPMYAQFISNTPSRNGQAMQTVVHNYRPKTQQQFTRNSDRHTLPPTAPTQNVYSTPIGYTQPLYQERYVQAPYPQAYYQNPVYNAQVAVPYQNYVSQFPSGNVHYNSNNYYG